MVSIGGSSTTAVAGGVQVDINGTPYTVPTYTDEGCLSHDLKCRKLRFIVWVDRCSYLISKGNQLEEGMKKLGATTTRFYINRISRRDCDFRHYRRCGGA